MFTHGILHHTSLLQFSFVCFHFLICTSFLPNCISSSRWHQLARKSFKHTLQTRKPPQKCIISVFWSCWTWHLYPHYFELLEHNTHTHTHSQDVVPLVIGVCETTQLRVWGHFWVTVPETSWCHSLSFSCFIILFGCFWPFSDHVNLFTNPSCQYNYFLAWRLVCWKRSV